MTQLLTLTNDQRQENKFLFNALNFGVEARKISSTNTIECPI